MIKYDMKKATESNKYGKKLRKKQKEINKYND